jgi:plasmid stabilization system protein ParE
MTWTVVWKPDAEQHLAAIWSAASDRGAVTRAADEIDFRLRLDPENKGESRPKDRRILFVYPLAIIFRVLPADRLVRVLAVWKYAHP